MNPTAVMRRSDARIWLGAFMASLVLNALVLVVLGLMAIRSIWLTAQSPAEPAPPEEEVSVFIMPIEPAPQAPPPAGKSFARTSADQLAPAPENAAFIGERNTQATSDAAPVADAPVGPSQDGIEPRVEDELETTQSNYQDGDLAHDQLAEEAVAPTETTMIQPTEEPAHESSESSGTEEELPEVRDPKPAREQLVDGPFPVDLPVEPDPIMEDPKPSPDERLEKEEEEKAVSEQPKPAVPATRDPGFRGFQQKTRLSGSISRRGTSALDVEDSELGRYHAAISRAIEKSWQRKVIQNRDFITPGVIRVQVVLDGNGKVRSVGSVDEFGIGAIQKGFTFSAIREADLPPLPGNIRQDLDGEPIELLYNFIF